MQSSEKLLGQRRLPPSIATHSQSFSVRERTNGARRYITYLITVPNQNRLHIQVLQRKNLFRAMWRKQANRSYWAPGTCPSWKKNNSLPLSTYSLIIMRAFIIILFLAISSGLSAQTYTLKSPDGKICLDIDLSDELSYSVSYRDKQVIHPSPMGFELQDEPAMHKGFTLLSAPQTSSQHDSWTRS